MKYTHEIALAARARALETDLVEAIVRVESSGIPWAWNPEPAYRYVYDVRAQRPFRKLTSEEASAKRPPADFFPLAGDPDQEWWAQQASWGLMQVMGALARELGFRGPYLTQLVDPATNLAYGCRQLALLMTWAEGDLRKAVGAYNAGRGGWNGPAGQAYAEKVEDALVAIRRGL